MPSPQPTNPKAVQQANMPQEGDPALQNWRMVPFTGLEGRQAFVDWLKDKVCPLAQLHINMLPSRACSLSLFVYL
jgi:hypothetical protein